MTMKVPALSADGNLQLTSLELDLLDSNLKAHDRGGFYLTYNAMTNSEEASLQARIATFSGSVGGAAFGANRLGQEEIGPGTEDGRYPGIYLLSQEIAESAYSRIELRLPDNAGFLENLDFFDSARQAWINRGVVDYFPGNLVDASLNVLSEMASAFAAAFSAKWADSSEEDDAHRLKSSIDGALTRLDSLFTPGAMLSVFATLVYDRFEKQPSNMSGGQYVQGPNGFQIYVGADGHVQGAFLHDYNDTLVEVTGNALATALNISLQGMES